MSLFYSVLFDRHLEEFDANMVSGGEDGWILVVLLLMGVCIYHMNQWWNNTNRDRLSGRLDTDELKTKNLYKLFPSVGIFLFLVIFLIVFW